MFNKKTIRQPSLPFSKQAVIKSNTQTKMILRSYIWLTFGVQQMFQMLNSVWQWVVSSTLKTIHAILPFSSILKDGHYGVKNVKIHSKWDIMFYFVTVRFLNHVCIPNQSRQVSFAYGANSQCEHVAAIRCLSRHVIHDLACLPGTH